MNEDTRQEQAAHPFDMRCNNTPTPGTHEMQGVNAERPTGRSAKADAAAHTPGLAEYQEFHNRLEEALEDLPPT